ncbi:hypothetical protein HA052_15085 [Chromobacterium haemolyticum]|uniref:Uncharacterized protein n=1 Tax=Chromobacterium fluminis TaxID=3044269 RepID=A0ABX0L6V6_9NEIS|nr:hypothetical protein [Chromobacterium haemolyticum]NHR06515.1 hypothetical protein [Chromobacterium haemolyticum]
MYEWHVKYSETKINGSLISCEVYTATVIADSEEEARAIMAEAEPDMVIDSLNQGEAVDES